MIHSRRYRILALFQTTLIFVLVPTARSLQVWITSHPSLVRLCLLISLCGFLTVLVRLLKRPEARVLWLNRQAALYKILPMFIMLVLLGTIISTPVEWFHLLLYAVLAGLFYLGFRAHQLPALSSFLICSLVSLLDELFQYIQPERFFDLWDLALNAFSALFGLLLTTHACNPAKLAQNSART